MKKLTILSVMGPRLPWPPGPVMNCSAAVGGMVLVVSGLRAGRSGVGGTEPSPPVPALAGSKSE